MMVQRGGAFLLVALASLLILVSPPVVSQGGVVNKCGDGVKNATEECDDGNINVVRDGCSKDCTIDELFDCEEDTEGKSVCTHVVVDFNSSSSDSLDYSTVYFGDTVFLADPNLLDASAFGDEDWKTVEIQLTNAVDSLNEQINYDPREAARNNRISDSDAQNVLTSVTEGHTGLSKILTRTGNVSLSLVLLSLYYENYISLAVRDSMTRRIVINVTDRFNIKAEEVNVMITYVGLNENPPVIAIQNNVITYVEGSAPVALTSSLFNISDADNDYYEIQSATVSLTPCLDCPSEVITISEDIYSVDRNYNGSTAVLTLSGNASESVYTRLLRSLIYGYADTSIEPTRPLTRTVSISVSDWDFTTNETILITIININDKPVVTFNGASLSNESFTEGDDPIQIANGVNVSDSDDAVLARAFVNLTNAARGDVLNVTRSSSLIIVIPHSDSTILEFRGNATADEYSRLLSSVQFHNPISDPGDVADHQRKIYVSVKDPREWSNPVFSYIDVTAVNDRPVFHFGPNPNRYGSPAERLHDVVYVEDDPSLALLPPDFTLRDVESPILTTVNIGMTQSQLLDGNDEGLEMNVTLTSDFNISSIPATSPAKGAMAGYLLTGQQDVDNYRKLLLTVKYTNSKTSAISTGVRDVTFLASDSETLPSDLVTVRVTVKDRNDPPRLNLGVGYGKPDTVTFKEEGAGIDFVTKPYLIEFDDEETGKLSKVTLTLRSEPAGYLDAGDYLYTAKPDSSLTFEASSDLGNTYTLTFTGEASHQIYYEALQGIRYINVEDEPTVYVGDTFTKIKRYIDVTIWDNGTISAFDGSSLPAENATVSTMVMVELTKNDHAPVLTLTSLPSSCSLPPEAARSKRSVTDEVFDDNAMRLLSRNDSIPTAPRVLTASGFGAMNDRLDAGSVIAIRFDSDTNRASLATPSRIFDFSPSFVSDMYHFAVWNDSRTMLVVFPHSPSKAQSTRLASVREFRINFKAPRGLCDCDRHICSVGDHSCHVIGSYSVFSGDSDEVASASTAPSTSLRFDWLFVPIIFAGVWVLIIGVCCAQSKKNNSRNAASKQMRCAGVEDVERSAGLKFFDKVQKPVKNSKRIR